MSNGKFEDLTEQVFGRWTVQTRRPYKYSKVAWECRWVCGVVKDVPSINLKSGALNLTEEV